MQNILRAKCVILGYTYCGKTAIIQTFLGDGSKYIKNYHMTPGLDIQQKVIKIPDTDASVQLFLYDTSGKEFYSELVMQLMQGPSMVLLVFDVTSEESLAKAEGLLIDLRKKVGNDALKGVLFGNKTDLKTRRRVNPKLASEIAKKLDLVYLEGSAADQSGIETPFFYLANEWYKIYLENARALKMGN